VKKNLTFDKGLIFLILIFVVAGGTVIFFISRFRSDEITTLIEEEGLITAAFMITGEENELLASQIFFYHPGAKKGALLDIPPNTGDLIDSLKRIDGVSVLFRRDRPQGYVEKLAKLIDAPIPFYFVITLSQARTLVDLNGGLEVFIPDPLELPETMVFLPSGSVRLDGDKAVLYLREAPPGEDDTEGVERREQFLRGLLRGWARASGDLTNPQVFPRLWKNLSTNLSSGAVRSFLLELPRLNQDQMVVQRVLGTNRIVDGKELLFRHREGMLLIEMVRQTVKSLEDREPLSSQEAALSLEILNGSAVAGLAGRTGQIFQNYGYEIFRVGNYDNFDQEYTLVIGHTEDTGGTQRAASLIRCTRVEYRPLLPPEEGESRLSPEITIILGKDFDGQYCKP
jgi:anionic cell wall polymer biosynthesis LytR-Cps2A-Psr (LCP) family protein